MSELTLGISLAIFFAILLLSLLRPRHLNGVKPGPSIDRTAEGALPKHYRFFPQIRQALSTSDYQYLREAASPQIAHQVIQERQTVAKSFLRGLREDFSNLERLARMVASLSPAISRQQETERLLLSLRFRILYTLVWLRLSTGQVPLQQIEHLTELIGALALRMEHAMAEISALSGDRLAGEINA